MGSDITEPEVDLEQETAALLQADGWDAAVSRLFALSADRLGVQVELVRSPRDIANRNGAVDIPLAPVGGTGGGMLRFLPADDAMFTPDRFFATVAELVAEQLAWRERASHGWRQRVERIQAVLAEQTLPMAFQPIVDLRSENVVGYEALARFAGTPVRTPDKWFDEAAAVGLGIELEVLAVAAAVRSFDLIPEPLYLSVNVSPPAAVSPLLAGVLEDLPLHRLVVEITEHEEVADYARLNAALGPLRGAGVRLAVDDAGSGFASLRHVVKMQPDIVKLDTTLVHEIDTDNMLRALGYSLTAFASALQAQVVAEGVETEREVDALRFLGIPFAQGYFFARPGPLPVPDRVSQTTTV